MRREYFFLHLPISFLMIASLIGMPVTANIENFEEFVGIHLQFWEKHLKPEICVFKMLCHPKIGTNREIL